jgi:hypothetical protein
VWNWTERYGFTIEILKLKNTVVMRKHSWHVSESMLMKKGEFKSWVSVIYQKYLYEHDAFNEPVKPLKHYWNEYQWWLRREFRREQQQEIKKREYDEKYHSRKP